MLLLMLLMIMMTLINLRRRVEYTNFRDGKRWERPCSYSRLMNTDAECYTDDDDDDDPN